MTNLSCKACVGIWPGPAHFIADCGLTRAYLHEDQFFPGWTVLVLKRHANSKRLKLPALIWSSGE